MAGCVMNHLLGRYHDGELPQQARADLEKHLPACSQCSAEIEQMRAMSGALRSATMPRASAEFLARLEGLSDNVEDVIVIRFVRRLTAVAAAILLAATLHWALPGHAPATQSQVSVAVSSSDERMIIDPESAASNALPDANPVAMANTQLDALGAGLSGGRP